MGRRGRKITRAVKTRYPRVVAVGRISPAGREIRICFESMGPVGQAAVRRVFKSTARAEEIANA